MSDTPNVLYAGDGEKKGAAGYLSLVLEERGFDYLHFSPRRLADIPKTARGLARFDAIVLSDAPAKKLGRKRMQAIKEYVLDGGGLGMMGGWESFGSGGYKGTPVEEVLPIACAESGIDDRRNSHNGFKMVRGEGAHPILENLPWDRAPTICGYNLVNAASDSRTLLTAKEIFSTNYSIGKAVVEGVELASNGFPLLVVQESIGGRSLAFTTDVAPHWAGCLLDWPEGSRVGPWAGTVSPISRQRAGKEVGSYYVKFFGQMLDWLTGKR